MKRLFAWLAGGVGAGAAYRALRRRPATVAEDPADELRAKLAFAREAGDAPSARSAKAEPDPEPEEPLDPDARRRDVHEAGRAAIDELRGES
jgi:hypothetical protein